MSKKPPMTNSNIEKLDKYGSGSYLASDVTVLLDIVDKDAVADVPVSHKEALIQSGQRHYSDMLTLEQAPTAMHEQLYAQALKQGTNRTATDIANLAHTLHNTFLQTVNSERPLVLVSLVRAGLPVGVLLQRALSDKKVSDKKVSDKKGSDKKGSDKKGLDKKGLDKKGLDKKGLDKKGLDKKGLDKKGLDKKGLDNERSDADSDYSLPSVHYGISIIRDRGLDPIALQMILDAYPDSPIVFVDGWTGKGAIYQELARSLEVFSDPSHPNFANIFHQGKDTIPLLTLADPAGVAWLAASEEDWLIPSGLLNSTVSGLISRSLYTEPQSGLHRSVFYDNLIEADHSLAFIDHIDTARRALTIPLQCLPTFKQPRYQTADLINELAITYQISNRNRIKPTIAEATRAILRRDPERILLATADHPDTVLLRHLCAQRDINITVLGAKILPYQAITLIKQRSKDN